MAKNIVFEDFRGHLRVACTAPASPKSSDPVLFGDRAGVALTDMGADGRTTVLFQCVATLPVSGVNGAGNSAVKDGDVLYYTAGDATPISKKATGQRFGVAAGAPADPAGATLIAAGSSATIRVYVGL